MKSGREGGVFMVRRVLLFGLLLLCLASFAWAGGQGESAKKTITHYHWTETTFDKINNHAVAVFQAKHPNVTVKLLLLPDADRKSAIRTALAANGDIDSFALSNGDSAEFLSAGQAVPIDPKGFGKKSLQEVLDMWNPGSIESAGGYWEGKYYGIPVELSNYVAWVNVADMKDAGLDPANKPKTWDDFHAMTKTLVVEENGVRSRNGFECNGKTALFTFLVVSDMMQQLGLDWGTDKGFLASMNKPDLLAKGLKNYTDFVTERSWDPGFSGEDRQGFANNKTATMLTGGTWFWGVIDTGSVPRTDANPFAYPRFAGGKDLGGMGYGNCVYVSKLAKDPALTFEWLDTMASQPNEFIKAGLFQPRKTLSDGTVALDQALGKQSIPFYNEVFKGELTKTGVWLSSVKTTQIQDAVWAAVSRVIFESGSVTDSVAQLQKDIRSILQ
jgi:ABC-type glycerol-3-phosphate transport system substrate-binding protein